MTSFIALIVRTKRLTEAATAVTPSTNPTVLAGLICLIPADVTSASATLFPLPPLTKPRNESPEIRASESVKDSPLRRVILDFWIGW